MSLRANVEFILQCVLKHNTRYFADAKVFELNFLIEMNTFIDMHHPTRCRLCSNCGVIMAITKKMCVCIQKYSFCGCTCEDCFKNVYQILLKVYHNINHSFGTFSMPIKKPIPYTNDFHMV